MAAPVSWPAADHAEEPHGSRPPRRGRSRGGPGQRGEALVAGADHETLLGLHPAPDRPRVPPRRVHGLGGGDDVLRRAVHLPGAAHGGVDARRRRSGRGDHQDPAAPARRVRGPGGGRGRARGPDRRAHRLPVRGPGTGHRSGRRPVDGLGLRAGLRTVHEPDLRGRGGPPRLEALPPDDRGDAVPGGPGGGHDAAPAALRAGRRADRRADRPRRGGTPALAGRPDPGPAATARLRDRPALLRHPEHPAAEVPVAQHRLGGRHPGHERCDHRVQLLRVQRQRLQRHLRCHRRSDRPAAVDLDHEHRAARGRRAQRRDRARTPAPGRDRGRGEPAAAAAGPPGRAPDAGEGAGARRGGPRCAVGTPVPTPRSTPAPGTARHRPRVVHGAPVFAPASTPHPHRGAP